MTDDVGMLFVVPCPVPDGRTARDLYQKRITGITDEMRANARARGCRFHRAWHAADGSALRRRSGRSGLKWNEGGSRRPRSRSRQRV